MENAEKIANGLADEIMRQRGQLKRRMAVGFFYGVLISSALFSLGVIFTKLLTQ